MTADCTQCTGLCRVGTPSAGRLSALLSLAALEASVKLSKESLPILTGFSRYFNVICDIMWFTSQCFCSTMMVALGSESSFRIRQHLQEWDVLYRRIYWPRFLWVIASSAFGVPSVGVHWWIPYKSDLHFIYCSGRVNKILWHRDLCFAKVWVFHFFPLKMFSLLWKKALATAKFDCMPWVRTLHKSLSTLFQCPLKASILDFWVQLLCFFWTFLRVLRPYQGRLTIRNRMVFWIFCSFGI